MGGVEEGGGQREEKGKRVDGVMKRKERPGKAGETSKSKHQHLPLTMRTPRETVNAVDDDDDVVVVVAAAGAQRTTTAGRCTTYMRANAYQAPRRVPAAPFYPGPRRTTTNMTSSPSSSCR
jgi:hypothetical protein